MTTALTVHQPNNAEAYRASTDAAGLCRDIVVSTAMEIDRRKYVKVEGWQAIAIAHGCSAGARDVERVDGGVRATGEVRRMSDGALISQAEGFVGEDEATWYGGETEVNEWVNGRKTGKKVKKILPKRADYAIRAMAQTRAISRACRSAFAHVVVMMNAGLSTTPAEEVPMGGFDDEPRGETRNVTPAPQKVLNPATGRMVDPMSPNQARKDGRGERFNALLHEIPDLTEVTGCLAWGEENAAEIHTMPDNWQKDLRETLALRISDLKRALTDAPPAPYGKRFDVRGNPIEEETDPEAEVMFHPSSDHGLAGDSVVDKIRHGVSA